MMLTLVRGIIYGLPSGWSINRLIGTDTQHYFRVVFIYRGALKS